MASLVSLQPFVDRLTGQPVEALYALIFGASFAEGVLPPVPGDVAAAFLAFLSARSGGLWLPTTLAVACGSVAGNSVVWWLGRRFGANWLAHQMARFKLTKSEEQTERAEHRIEEAYREYGWVALFISRFIPGLRAMAPAAAGAVGVPLWETAAILFAASAIWYSVVTWIAFRVGSDWEAVKAALLALGRDVGIGATGLAAAALLVGWWIWRRRRARTLALAASGGSAGSGGAQSGDVAP